MYIWYYICIVMHIHMYLYMCMRIYIYICMYDRKKDTTRWNKQLNVNFFGEICWNYSKAPKVDRFLKHVKCWGLVGFIHPSSTHHLSIHGSIHWSRQVPTSSAWTAPTAAAATFSESTRWFVSRPRNLERRRETGGQCLWWGCNFIAIYTIHNWAFDEIPRHELNGIVSYFICI